MGMRIDFSDFEKGWEKLVRESAPSDLARGQFRAASLLLQDAIAKSPTAPFKSGALWRSATIQTPDGAMHELDRPEPGDVGKGNEMSAGFNIVYAARWHELSPDEDRTINWTVPGPHRKYLEIKLRMYGKDYVKVMAKFLTKRLGGK